MNYPLGFREAMVKRMTEPGRRPTVELAVEVGVHPSTLSRWVRETGSVGDMSRTKIKSPRPDDKTPEEKLQLVLEASLLTDEELGVFLRENGLHEAQLKRWQQEALSGLTQQKKTPLQLQEIRGLKKEIHERDNAIHERDKEIHKRDKEIRRKDKALAEAAALLVLKKKVEALWGDGEDDTE